MPGFETREQNLSAIIRVLGIVILSLIGLLAYQFYTFRDVGKIEFVDIPAHAIGGRVDRVVPGVMQKTTVYDFTERTFQTMHRWAYNGAEEYEKNIRKFEDVLTPEYMAFLRRDFKRRLGNEVSSELQGRTRMMLPIATGWNENRVKVTSTKNGKPASWVVFIDMELIEKLKGQQVKHLYLRYPIKVVLQNGDREGNPWFLALDGYQSDPKRLEKDMDKVTGDNNENFL
ncbi:MAG: DUF2895 family protein [Methylococcaceae bacterium]|nr:DUF2895 family protein [Methylococcaceae bacterium]